MKASSEEPRRVLIFCFLGSKSGSRQSGEDSVESLSVGTVFIIRLIVLDICEEIRL